MGDGNRMEFRARLSREVAFGEGMWKTTLGGQAECLM